LFVVSLTEILASQSQINSKSDRDNN